MKVVMHLLSVRNFERGIKRCQGCFMREITPLLPENFYLISNRGINGEDIIKESRNYYYFFKQYNKYAVKIADTYAYCLLRNEFKFLIRVKKPEKKDVIDINFTDSDKKVINIISKLKFDPSLQLSHFFNSYAQAINKSIKRTGGLFESPFRRELIKTEKELKEAMSEIHFYSQKSGISSDYRHYSFSSYSHIIKETVKTLTAYRELFGNKLPFCQNAVRVCNLNVKAVLELFGGIKEFIKYHDEYSNRTFKKQP